MDFFENIVGKCEHFFNTYILPELMTRKLQHPMDTSEINEQPLYCYCKTAEEPGNPMIACDALIVLLSGSFFVCWDY